MFNNMFNLRSMSTKTAKEEACDDEDDEGEEEDRLRSRFHRRYRLLSAVCSPCMQKDAPQPQYILPSVS